MRRIRKASKSEQEESKKYVEIHVKDARGRYDYWTCDECDIAFEGDDKILHCTETDTYHCSQEKKLFFGPKTCKNQVYGINNQNFEKYYRFVDIKSD